MSDIDDLDEIAEQMTSRVNIETETQTKLSIAGRKGGTAFYPKHEYIFGSREKPTLPKLKFLEGKDE